MGCSEYPARVPPMSTTAPQPQITTFRKGRRIGVNRDGQPVGLVYRLGDSEYTMTLYTKDCPWEAHAGVATSEDDAIATVARRGETPDHLEKP
jgi:hypothetical protein